MKVKFCGITTLDDAHEAVRLGAWAIGLNYWPDSPRRCDPATAVAIAAELRRKVEVVGVFVSPTLREVAAAVEDANLSMVQLHGDEGPAFCSEVGRRTGAKVIKALPVRSAADIQAAQAFRTDFHLLDAYRAGARGGTGTSFDWELARGHSPEIPMILAGGLTPENVADAIEVVHPFAVDVASGIESAPGIKDHELMAAFAENARGPLAAVDPVVP